jgi:acetyltransferase-like isoleucine patch superfamily enzyme
MTVATQLVPGERIEGDWIDRPLPANLKLASSAFLESTFSFLAFSSEREIGFTLEEGAGVYGNASFIVGPRGCITVGAYACLNACYVFCDDQITIGAHCLIGWGAVLSDCWPAATMPRHIRRQALRTAAAHPARYLASPLAPRSVILEDNVWVGFEAVVLPGVRLGRGCIVGSRTVVAENIPPYAVVAGDPPRIVRWLEPDDTTEARENALRVHFAGESR